MIDAETLLPAELIQRASLRGREYAWRFCDLPAVIEAARDAHLLNYGGQLQFRFPSATCECYWVEIDAVGSLPSQMPWSEKVDRAAQTALDQLSALQKRYDFLAEGRRSFPIPFAQFAASGHDPIEAMYFVWYVDTEIGDAATKKLFRDV